MIEGADLVEITKCNHIPANTRGIVVATSIEPHPIKDRMRVMHRVRIFTPRTGVSRPNEEWFSEEQLILIKQGYLSKYMATIPDESIRKTGLEIVAALPYKEQLKTYPARLGDKWYAIHENDWWELQRVYTYDRTGEWLVVSRSGPGMFKGGEQND